MLVARPIFYRYDRPLPFQLRDSATPGLANSREGPIKKDLQIRGIYAQPRSRNRPLIPEASERILGLKLGQFSHQFSDQDRYTI